MNKKLAENSLLTALVLVFSLTACGGETAEDQQDGQQAETGTHTITDHAGYEIEVPDEVDRIVVCDILPLPSVLTVFFDSADKIVGMSEPSMTAAVRPR